MSFVVYDQDPKEPGTRGRRLGLLIAGILAVLVLAAFILGRATSSSEDPGPPPAPVSPTGLTWQSVGGQPVPVSPEHGPSRRGATAASGFAHDEMGAVIAAINIGARLTPAAGSAVVDATARSQCVGDVTALLSSVTAQGSSQERAGQTTPSEYLYRLSGDPTSDVVTVSVTAVTPQATALGGYAELTRTLEWHDGDWKVQVPFPALKLVKQVDGYTSLGRTGA